MQDLPAAEEMRSWEISEINKLRSQIEQIPLESCETYFTDEIKGFLKDYENVELDTITIEQDNLSVIEGKNNQSLSNLIFHVNIIVDTTNHVDSYDWADEISDRLLRFFDQYSYYNLKVKQTDINTLALNKCRIHSVQAYSSPSNETVFVEQPEDEYAVQTAAFSFYESNPEFILRKFGVISDSEHKELYVEYYVHDDYFDFKNMETAESSRRLYCLKKYRPFNHFAL